MSDYKTDREWAQVDEWTCKMRRLDGNVAEVACEYRQERDMARAQLLEARRTIDELKKQLNDKGASDE